MERLASLINSLKTAFEEGRSVTELLSLTDELRSELTRSLPILEPEENQVSVWLPAGYQSKAQKISPPETISDHQILNSDTKKETPFISSAIIDSIQKPEVSEVVLAEERNIQQSIANRVAIGVPRPPQVAFMEDSVEEEEHALEGKLEPDSPREEFLLPGNYPIRPSGIFRENLPGPSKLAEHEQSDEKPVVVELELPEETDILIKDDLRNPAMVITENFLKGAGNTITETRPLELHEILANRVVAQPSNIETPKQARVLADTLSGGKITDLRKAISINDRFRLIKSLFRGDDSLFERSVKTINNFNILQEAQYWMQRELVIKLGWNEEDELVQMFYQLVSRRFL